MVNHSHRTCTLPPRVCKSSLGLSRQLALLSLPSPAAAAPAADDDGDAKDAVLDVERHQRRTSMTTTTTTKFRRSPVFDE